MIATRIKYSWCPRIGWPHNRCMRSALIWPRCSSQQRRAKKNGKNKWLQTYIHFLDPQIQRNICCLMWILADFAHASVNQSDGLACATQQFSVRWFFFPLAQPASYHHDMTRLKPSNISPDCSRSNSSEFTANGGREKTSVIVGSDTHCAPFAEMYRYGPFVHAWFNNILVTCKRTVFFLLLLLSSTVWIFTCIAKPMQSVCEGRMLRRKDRNHYYVVMIWALLSVNTNTKWHGRRVTESKAAICAPYMQQHCNCNSMELLCRIRISLWQRLV